MTQYNMLDAKNNLSKICRMIVNEEEDFVVIASNGKPLVKIVPYVKNEERKIGVLNGKYKIDMKLFNDLDADISDMFYGE